MKENGTTKMTSASGFSSFQRENVGKEIAAYTQFDDQSNKASSELAWKICPEHTFKIYVDWSRSFVSRGRICILVDELRMAML